MVTMGLLQNITGKLGKASKAAESSVQQKQNWYIDRYQKVIVQRNIFIFITIISIVGIMVAIITVRAVTLSKKIDPFVIQIEEKSGITNIVQPLKRITYTNDEVVKNYFLRQYVRAREEYNHYTFDYNYYTLVKIMSYNNIYRDFKRTISDANPKSPLLLGTHSNKNIKITSILYPEGSFGKENVTATVRFTSEIESNGSVTQQQNKIATITFDFANLEMTEDQRAINPLGFRVKNYQITTEAF